MFSLAWATFAVALVGMSIGAAQGYFAWARHLRETGQPMREEAARRSLENDGGLHRVAAEAADWRCLTLFRQAGGCRVKLRRIRVLGFRPGEIALPAYTDSRPRPNGGSAPELFPKAGSAGRKIDFAEEMGAGQPGVLLLGRLSSRSLWSSSNRLEIRVIAEEISSMRRQISIVVRSEEIALVAEASATKK